MGNEFNINDENSFITTNNRFFYNSKSVFIQYEDILGLPWFTYVSVIRSSYNQLNKILNLDYIKNIDLERLLMWYVSRKNENPIYELIREKDKVTKEQIDEFLHNELNNPKGYVFFETFYNFMTIPDALEKIIVNKFVDQVFIYSKQKNDNLEKFINNEYKGSIYLYGNLEDALKEVPNDSTYIVGLSKEFFDTMIKLDKLNFSSIASPVEYSYLGPRDEIIKYIDSLSHKFLFKFHMLNTIR